MKHNIVGLGSAGNNIAKYFEQFPEYDVFKIDSEASGDEKEKNYFQVKEQDHPEKYEKNVPNLKKFFGDIEGNVLFIVGGSGFISAISLGVLEQIKHCNIDILYIKPDVDFLSEIRMKHERVVYGVLQEYARSGVFQQMIIVNNNDVEAMIGEISIDDYYSKINETIGFILHSMNVLEHNKTIMNNFSPFVETARISTIGMLEFEKDSENLFFPLDIIREKRYYYNVSQEKASKDGKLYKKIREQIRNKKTGQTKVSYGIYSCSEKDNFVFVLAKSSEIQK